MGNQDTVIILAFRDNGLHYNYVTNSILQLLWSNLGTTKVLCVHILIHIYSKEL